VQKFLKFMRLMEEQEQTYHSRARALIDWTRHQSHAFSTHEFGDTLDDAVRAFSEFCDYVTVAKPGKLAEKLAVESLYAEVQTELLVNNRRPFVPAGDLTPEAVDQAFDELAKKEKGSRSSCPCQSFPVYQKGRNKVGSGEIR